MRERTFYETDDGLMLHFKPVKEDEIKIVESNDGKTKIVGYLTYDEDPDIDWLKEDEYFHLACFSRKFAVNPLKLSLEEARELYKENNSPKYYVFGVEAYIHGGVVLDLEGEGDFVDRAWDVSLVGVLLAEKKYFNSYQESKEGAREYIEEWNKYLRGDVYGIVIEKFENGSNQGEVVDGEWGYLEQEYAEEELEALMNSYKKEVEG